MRPHSTTITGRDRRREARPISLVPIPMQLCVRPVRRDGSPRCFCTGKKTPGRAGTHTGHTGAHRHTDRVTVFSRITQTNLTTRTRSVSCVSRYKRCPSGSFTRIPEGVNEDAWCDRLRARYMLERLPIGIHRTDDANGSCVVMDMALLLTVTSFRLTHNSLSFTLVLTMAGSALLPFLLGQRPVVILTIHLTPLRSFTTWIALMLLATHTRSAQPRQW